ncbi:hypothetical protein ALC60_09543 [Trachymyrmex zeteki]|uniref:Mos1 transposase HTH domain-containing protein n=1 Tax=Mycetomoellerius zeteki TaxID=64791 RepID=A0A151WUD8_9HYME|nr:hypothetical protein ALC60_09543 [Trachymyrmex zeteki]
MEKEQYRSVIRFLFLDGKTCEEIKTKLDAVYGNPSPSMTTVRYTWGKAKTITGQYYADLLGRFDVELKKKRPHLAKKSKLEKIARKKIHVEEVIAETEAYFAEFDKSYFSEGLKKMVETKLRNMVRLIPELNEIDTSCEYRTDQRTILLKYKHLARYKFEDNFVGLSKAPKSVARTSKISAALLIMLEFPIWKFLSRRDKIVRKKILNTNIFELTAAFASPVHLEINSRRHRMLFNVIDDGLSLVLPKTSQMDFCYLFKEIKNIDEISLTRAHFTKACKCEVQLMSTLTEFREEDSHERTLHNEITTEIRQAIRQNDSSPHQQVTHRFASQPFDEIGTADDYRSRWRTESNDDVDS